MIDIHGITKLTENGAWRLDAVKELPLNDEETAPWRAVTENTPTQRKKTGGKSSPTAGTAEEGGKPGNGENAGRFRSTSAASQIIGLLRSDPVNLRNAVILSEIIGKPVGMR